jgi:hypothetical protein
LGEFFVVDGLAVPGIFAFHEGDALPLTVLAKSSSALRSFAGVVNGVAKCFDVMASTVSRPSRKSRIAVQVPRGWISSLVPSSWTPFQSTIAIRLSA